MGRAFRIVLGRAPDSSSGTDADLWQTAVRLAREGGFRRPIQLVDNSEGGPVYAYVIRGTAISDPHRSECGRFAVNPIGRYGLTADEISALEQANAHLRAQRSQSSTDTTPGRPESQPAFDGTLAGIRRRYPMLEEWHTGGGCMALRLDGEGGSYVLITDTEGARIPDESATEVAVGRYAANGDSLGDADTLSLTVLPDWIDRSLLSATDPQNVADYFIVKLGEDPRDETLYELPLSSACGDDCRKAVDAAVGLIAHVRAAFGRDGEIRPGTRVIRRTPESAVVEMARLVIGAYWRG